MQKFILAFAIAALVPCVYVAVADAEDYEEEYEEYDEEETEVTETRGVAKRMSCDDIKKEMDELNALEELDETQSGRLNTLKTDYRSKCMKKASGRSVGRAKVSMAKPKEVTVTQETVDDTEKSESKTDATCTTPDKNGCCPGEEYTDLGEQGFNCCKEDDKNLCYPPMKIQKDYSLCDDGTEPDKNGCCAGEKYTDLGDQGFNCCKDDGKTCFPPIK